MVTAVLLLSLGLLLLYAGGESLVLGAYGMARRLGISPLAVGLTVVAFGTSTPELVVSLDAALGGSNDIALGNIVGSNIANIALILGVAALITPTVAESKVVRQDCPLMIGVSVLLVVMLMDGVLSRIEGALLIGGLATFTSYTLWQSARSEALQAAVADAAEAMPVARPLKASALVLLGLALLVAGGNFVVDGAVTIAAKLGLSQAVIGLTIVAVGTSLPELSTSVIAAMRRQGDIAIGNVVGSNLFNILGILGITTLVLPVQRGDIRWLDLGLMVALAVLLPVLLHWRGRLQRGTGFALLAIFIGYTVSLV